MVAPLTGPFTSTGKQVAAGAQFYLQQNGNTVAGKKIELIIKDDGGIADQTRRLVQELIVNDKVNAIAGFGLTPLALAAAPLATQSKTPMIVMAAATSIVTERSPYIVRTSFAQAQPVVVIADWQARHGMKKAVSMVSDFAPGYDSETFFKDSFTRAGGQVVEALRIPLQNPDFAPFLQRARDATPDGLFVFVPAGQAAALMRQFVGARARQVGDQAVRCRRPYRRRHLEQYGRRHARHGDRLLLLGGASFGEEPGLRGWRAESKQWHARKLFRGQRLRWNACPL